MLVKELNNIGLQSISYKHTAQTASQSRIKAPNKIKCNTIKAKQTTTNTKDDKNDIKTSD